VSRRKVAKPKAPKATTAPKTTKPKGKAGKAVSPKRLRHGVGVAAVTAGIPLNMVQKWLGHAQLTTTAIYANAVGADEKDIARKM
jgi:site-specific recombinase XerD